VLFTHAFPLLFTLDFDEDQHLATEFSVQHVMNENVAAFLPPSLHAFMNTAGKLPTNSDSGSRKNEGNDQSPHTRH
jgi:hypothetical protein